MAADLTRPLIGVTTSEVRFAESVHHTPESDPPRREMILGLNYLRAIEAAGGIPMVTPPLEHEAIEPLLGRLSGVCLPGGPDLDPEMYEQRPHPELGPIEPDLDRFELALARRADDRGLPVLAVCRGMQALNVARGGSLHQHLPDRPGVTFDHRQKVAGDRPAHPISVSPGSRLESLLGAREVEVNSFHHQAVDRLGSGLRAVAWAPDGVIEAVEAPARDFCVGVQWHAESMVVRREQAALFRGLVDAAARYESLPLKARAA